MRALIRNLFHRHPEGRDGLTQTQREAMIDLLLAAMYADRRVALQEDENIAAQLHTLSWDSGTAPETYLDQATAHVRDAVATKEGEVRLLEDIRDRLGTREARQHAFDLCVTLLKSDATETAEETRFERDIKMLFDLEASTE